jgi:hypothetical protein
MPLSTTMNTSVLTGADAPRSRDHLGYVALGVVTVVALVVTDVSLLAA